jgi:hypothetical protein
MAIHGPSIDDLPIEMMVFHGYAKLPEGKPELWVSLIVNQ